MKIIKYILLTFVIIGCNSSQISEEIQVLREFKEKEKFRIWKTEKNYNKADSMYSETKYFTSFDSLGRLINKNNSIFYTYNSSNRIVAEQSIYRRGRIIKVIEKEYKYDSQDNLEMILKIGETIDTIQKFRYDEKNRIIESKSTSKEINYKYEEGQLVEKILLERNSNPRISDFIYDNEGKLIIENWVFGNNHRMKTTFKYDERDRLISEVDSSYSKNTNPNTYIEFRTDYRYDTNDSIIEKINLGRILSGEEFKKRGRTTYKYE